MATGGPEERPCRAGYLVSQYPAVNQTFVLREIRILREAGFDVRVVSIRRPDRKPELLSAEEAEEYRQTSFIRGTGAGRIASLHAKAFFSRPIRYLQTLAFALALAGLDLRAAMSHLFYFGEAVVAGELFREQKVTHTHTHFTSTVMLLVSRLFPITFSVTIHGPDEFNDVIAFHMQEKVAAARFVAAISHFAASQIMRASEPGHWDKIRVLPLGVDAETFRPRPTPDGFEILCVGRLAAVKAHIVLIRAAGRLIAQGRNLRLVFVGDGPARPAIEREIAQQGLGDRVSVEGAINHDKVHRYYERAAVFALASFAEGVPVVLMEAMAMGVPCIATWVAGVPELIRNGVDGLLIPPADEAALAAAIAKLMDGPELAARLGETARQRVMQLYDVRKNTLELAAALRGASKIK